MNNLINTLDRIASKLEESNLIKEATEVDLIANSLEVVMKEGAINPFEKIKGLFKTPGVADKQKPDEYSTSPQQRAINIKEKFKDAGPAGKLLTMFLYRDVQNAYEGLPENVKKIVNKYTKKWQALDIFKKSAEEKEALFGDKGPAAAYKALDNMLSSFSKKYDVSLLPTSLTNKFNDLKSTIEQIEKSPEKIDKDVKPEEKSKPEEKEFSEEEARHDKSINRFLQALDKHFKNDLQSSLTPKLKAEYERMMGEIIAQLKGDIAKGFRGSTPGAYGKKKAAQVEAGKKPKGEKGDAKERSRPNPVFDHTDPKVLDNADHFPINTEGRGRNALARANQYSDSPSWYDGSLEELKKTVADAVKKAYPDIEVTEEAYE